MDKTAQDKIIQFSDQHDADLHKRVHQNLQQAGHPVSKADMKTDEHSALENLREGLEDQADVVGAAVEEVGDKLGGENVTYIEQRPSKDWKTRLMERIKGKKAA